MSSGTWERITGEATHLAARWRSAVNPEVVLTSLSVDPSEVVILRDAQSGTPASAVLTTATSVAVVDCGEGLLAIPLTADDLNFVGEATVVVKPAGALEQRFRLRVVNEPLTPESVAGKVFGQGLAELTDAGTVGNALRELSEQTEAIHAKLPEREFLVGTAAATGALAGADKTDFALSAAGVTAIQTGLASAAGQQTALDRLGNWTGTGINTVLGAFQAVCSKQASPPTDFGGTFDPAHDSLEAIAERVQNVQGVVAANIITVVSHQLPGGPIILVRGDSYQESNARPLSWVNETGAGWPVDLEGAVIRFTATRVTTSGPTSEIAAGKKIEVAGYVERGTAPNQEIRCELEATDTNKEEGLYNYDVEAILETGEVHTLITTARATLAAPPRGERAVPKLEILPHFSQSTE